jgi:hypothetical protein
VVPEPFPHVVVRDALDPDHAARLLDDFPPLATITGGAPSGGNERFDYSAAASLADPRLSDAWRAIVREHTSTAFAHGLFGIFADHLPAEVARARRRPGWPRAGIRGIDGKDVTDVLLDAQISVNTPVATPGTVKGPHVDRGVALFAGLFYLRPATDTSTGGDLELYRPAGPETFTRFEGQHVPDDAVELVETVEYAHNTLVIFLNSVRSLHGVTPRSVTDVPRYLVNLVCQVPEPLFDLGRHQADPAKWADEHPWASTARHRVPTRS